MFDPNRPRCRAGCGRQINKSRGRFCRQCRLSAPDYGVDWSWTALAACSQVGLEAFFPDGRANDHTYGPARLVCGGCSVRAECLEAALATEQPGYEHGLWGGLTPVERRKVRAARSA